MAGSRKDTMPMFYSDPAVLNAQSHADLALAPVRNFAFAGKVNCVPAILSEMTMLLPHYPVIFTAGAEPMLVAVLGVRNEENLFVDAAGNWEKNAYIPAYVRRYPFLLTRLPDGTIALGAEIDKAFFVEGGEARLFANRRPTKLSQDAYRFCTEYQQAFEETVNFCKDVHAAGLLKAKVCTIKPRTGASLKLSGFAAVEEQALDEIDNRTANGWRKRHWLKYLYYHIASLEHLKGIAARVEPPTAQP